MSVLISADITFTSLAVQSTASVGSTYVPPFAITVTYSGPAAAQTTTATGTVSHGNPNPTTPAFLKDYDWIDSYLTIHTMSKASYRYAYFGWFVVVLAVLVFGFLHLTGRRGGALGACWSKWALRKRTWRKKSTLKAIQKSSQRHRQPWSFPSNAQVTSLVFLFVIPILLCTVGPDYIAPGTAVWDLTHNLTRRGMPEGYSLMPRDDGPGVASTATTRPPAFTIQKTFWTAGGRTGIMAFSLFPLVVLFALKAPPFAILAIPFTIQIHFDKLARMHRWTGRLIWFVTTVHVVTWSVQLYNDKRHGHSGSAWNYVFGYHKFIYGVAGYGALTLLTLLSIKPIRTRYYEFFYISHIILVPAALVLSALHFPPIWWWCWAPLFLWILERGYRMIYFVHLNGLIGSLSKRPIQYGMADEDGVDGHGAMAGSASTRYGGSGLFSLTKDTFNAKKSYPQTPTGPPEAWEMDVVRNPKSLDGHPPAERVHSGDYASDLGWDGRARDSAATNNTGDTDETAAGEWSPNLSSTVDHDKHGELHYPPRRPTSYAPVPNIAAPTPLSDRKSTPIVRAENSRANSNVNVNGNITPAATPSTSRLHLDFPVMHPLPGILSSGANSAVARMPPPGFAKCILLAGRTLRLSVITARRFGWAPGQHVLLTIPEISRFTSHPFTVASVSDSAIAGPQGREMVLIIRAKRGFTGALWDEVKRRRDADETRKEGGDPEKTAMNSSTGRHGRDGSGDSFGLGSGAQGSSIRTTGVVLRAYVDGAFGSSVRAHWGSHSSVLIVCGGSGVSFGTSILEYLCLCLSGRDGRSLGGKSGGVGKDGFVTRRVRFVWLIREYAHVQWCAPILRRCMDMIPNTSILQVDVFVTNFSSESGHKTTLSSSANLPYMSGGDDSKLELGPDGTLIPPAPQFAKEGRKMERRLSTSSMDSVDSNASRGSEIELNYDGGGRDGSHRGAQTSDFASEDGHHVLDLTNFDGDDDTRAPGERQMSINVKKQGKLRRAQSRKQAAAALAKAELSQKAAANIHFNGAVQEEFNPYSQTPQAIPPLHFPAPRIVSPPPLGGPSYKNPTKPRNWDPSEISPMPQERGVSLFDPPVGAAFDPRTQTPHKWGDNNATATTARTMTSEGLQNLPPSSYVAPTPTPQFRQPRPPFTNDNRLSVAESLLDRNLSPSPYGNYYGDNGNSGFDTRTIGGSESLRNLMQSGGGARPSTPSTAWHYTKEDDVQLFDYDEQEIDDLNVVSEVARPGKPRLEKIIADEVERSRGAVAVACCGPSSLNALTRKVVASRIDPARIRRGDLRGQITLISEDFEW